MPGTLIYKGPSQLDGRPIVVIATTGSKNAKTGNMLQTWILRADVPPVQATKTGEDYSICGDCPHRGAVTGKRSCYVLPFQAPLKIYLTASAEVRAERRYKQLKEMSEDVSLAALLEVIKVRDDKDQNRAVAPLKPAPDAVILDSTQMSIQSVLDRILQEIAEKEL